MWLLNTKTLELRYFNGPRDVRAYAILSHVWEDTDKEYNFQSIKATYEKYRDSEEGAVAHAPDKIRRLCLLAAEEGFEWVWLDTACIDKTSSAELSEAINSMYAWYKAAHLCYAYLYDVSNDDNPFQPDSAFWRSRYHVRGWTLQELLASFRIIFLSASWSLVGTKSSLFAPLAKRTGIDVNILLHKHSVGTASVAQRMSWAAHRVTTREEDRAYSLMGIFGVTMPIIYGEGGERAFLRLQKEIIANCPDQSIFAWGSIHPDFDTAYDAIQKAQTFPYAGGSVTSSSMESLVTETDCNLLARSPSYFASCAGMRRVDPWTFLGLSGHSVDYRCSFSADGVTLYLPVSSHSMHLRDYTSEDVEKVRVVRAVALACTTASDTSETSIILQFLSGSPSSLDRGEDASQGLFSDAVGLLAAVDGTTADGTPEGSRIGLLRSGNCGGYGEKYDGWGTFYRGATLHLGGNHTPPKDEQPTGATLDFRVFHSVRTHFHRRQLHIQYPASRIVTFHPLGELMASIRPRSPDYVIELPGWIFHRLGKHYGWVYQPSPDSGPQTAHHTLRVTRSTYAPFYLLFVHEASTFGIAINAPCCNSLHLPYTLRDFVSLRVFFTPGVLDYGDPSGIEAALGTHEVLPRNSQTECGRMHLHIKNFVDEEDISITHFHCAFPMPGLRVADEELCQPVGRDLDIWYCGKFEALGREDIIIRVFTISMDLCHV